MEIQYGKKEIPHHYCIVIILQQTIVACFARILSTWCLQLNSQNYFDKKVQS